MAQTDITLDDLPPPRRNRALRLVIMVMMTLCGLIMAAILLSEPQVTAGVQSAAGQVSAQFGQSEVPALGSLEDLDRATELGPLDTPPPFSASPVAQNAAPDEPLVKPMVSRMPANRIPVRRAGN